MYGSYDMSGEYVTTAEAAEMLGVSRWTVMRMVKREELWPLVDVEPRQPTLFLRSDVLALLAAAAA